MSSIRDGIDPTGRSRFSPGFVAVLRSVGLTWVLVYSSKSVDAHQIGVDIDAPAAPVPAADDARVEKAIPIELISIGRVDCELTQLAQLIEHADRVVGHQDWHDESILFSVVESFDLKAVRESIGGDRKGISYEMFLTLPIGSTEPDGIAAIIAAPVAAEGMMRVIEEEEETLSPPDEDGFMTTPSGFLVQHSHDYCVLYGSPSTRWNVPRIRLNARNPRGQVRCQLTA